jgi:hypothetical protein
LMSLHKAVKEMVPAVVPRIAYDGTALRVAMAVKNAVKSEIKQLVRERKTGLHCRNVQLSDNEKATRRRISKNRDPDLNQEAICIFDTKTGRVGGRL